MDRERRTAATPSTAGRDWSETYMGGSPDAERALIAAVMPRVERIQDAVAAKQRADVRRAFHNKGAVVRIRFDVAPDLPDALRVAFLQPGASYQGFGRFSRSQSFRLRDKDRDQRGFAFRIETDNGAQDILLSNTPASFARDPVQFMKVAALFAEHPQPIAAILILPTVGLREGLRIMGDLLKPPDREVAFTSQRYWSRTAFQIGDAAARLFVRPTSEVRRVAIENDPDYLTTDLVTDLRHQPRSFELCAQLFVDEARTPIEDASLVWDERVAPPVVLGTVTILQQELDSPEANELAARVETLEAFSPTVTPGLRPLGRMNRARVIAYARSADHRRAKVPPGAGMTLDVRAATADAEAAAAEANAAGADAESAAKDAKMLSEDEIRATARGLLAANRGLSAARHHGRMRHPQPPDPIVDGV